MTMTGSATTSVVYEPDGLQARFPVPFPVFHTDDIRAVSVDGVRQTELANYTVEGVGTEEGVHVKFSTPPDFGPKLVLYRWTKRVQESDYPEGGRFPAKVVETDFDRLVAMAQEIDDQFEWTLKIPRGTDTSPIEYTESLFLASQDARAAAGEALESARESAASAQDAREMAAEAHSMAQDASDQATQAARQAEAAARSAEEAAHTVSQGIPDGSEIQKGIVRLATAEEHESGTPGLAATAEHVKTMFDGASMPGLVLSFSGAMAGPDGKHPVDRRTGKANLSYALCDGGTYTTPDRLAVTTPDLRDRFIIGAGGAYASAAAGGNATHTHTVSVGATTLTASQMPAHTHSGVLRHSSAASGLLYGGSGYGSLYDPGTNSTGGNGSHTHSAGTGAGSSLLTTRLRSS